MDFGPILANTIGQLLQELLAMSGTFAGLGLVFMSVAVTLTILFGIYNWWLSGSIQDLVSNFVKIILIVAPLMILLNGWAGYMKTFGNFFYTELPSHLGVSGGSPEAVAGDAILKIQQSVKFPDPPANSDKKSILGIKLPDISMALIYSAIIWTIAFLLNALLIFGILFAVFMPIAGLYIGMIFGPLILAWLPWKPLADMTSRWLGFMIGNGITFVVAIVILKAVSTALASMTTTMNQMAQDSFATGLAGYVVVSVALFAIYIFALNLMLQANNIAQGMTGGATVGEGLFGAMAAAGAAAGVARTAGATGNLHKMGAKAAGRAVASAPGAAGKAAESMGKSLQGAGVGAAIGNIPGAGTAAAAAGNLLRASAAPLGAAQAGIDKAGSVLSKGAGRVKDTGVYRELNKPALKPFSGGGGKSNGDGDGGKGSKGG